MAKFGTFGGIPAAAYQSQRELAENLGIHRETVTAVKTGKRGLSVDNSKAVAEKSGDKPATVYLTSQVESLKSKLAKKAITPAGVLGSATHMMRNLTIKFTHDQIDRSDPDFRRAALELKALAAAALDLSEADP